MLSTAIAVGFEVEFDHRVRIVVPSRVSSTITPLAEEVLYILLPYTSIEKLLIIVSKNRLLNALKKVLSPRYVCGYLYFRILQYT